MCAKISMIVPCLNGAATLPALFATVANARHSGLIRELIFVDGGSQDHSREIAHSAQARILETQAGRGHQLRAGATAASAPWLLFLHADSQLAAGWEDSVQQHITQSDAPACFKLRFDSDRRAARLIEQGVTLRTRLFNLPYGDQGLLISRALYAKVGGYPPQPLMEDVALARRLPKIRQLPFAITSSAIRYECNGYARQSSANLLRLLRYFAGTPPEKLARSYRAPSRQDP